MIGPKTEQQFHDTMIAWACGMIFWAVITLAVMAGCALWAEPADVNPLTGQEVAHGSVLEAC
jgi:hypothetical protein